MFKIWLEIPLISEALALLKGEAEVIGPQVRSDPKNPLSKLEEADGAIVSSLFPGTGETFNQAKKLKVIARVGIGYDNIDVEAATARGICVVNTPDAPTESTAEFTVTLMLATARRLKAADRQLSRGEWGRRPKLMGFDLAGKTLGLVGLGRIGGRVAEIAKALGMRVLAFDPYINAERAAALGVELAPDLSTVLRAADVLSLHAPLTEQTRGLIGTQELTQMKRGSILVNASRGPVVVESALLNALRSGHLSGAGLDVWDPEPPDPDNPLLQMDNVVVAPHIAGFTHEGRVRSNPEAVKQVLLALRGEHPTSLVNPAVWASRREN